MLCLSIIYHADVFANRPRPHRGIRGGRHIPPPRRIQLTDRIRGITNRERKHKCLNIVLKVFAATPTI